MSAYPSGPSFSDIEIAPRNEIVAKQEALLAQQLLYLNSHSAFYKAKLSDAKVDVSGIKRISDLAKIPFTYKHELRASLAAAPLLGLHQAAPLADIVQVQASSGTTGSPAYIGLTKSDLQAWTEMTARGLYACGVRPHDLVLHAFSMSKGFVGGIPMFQGLAHLGAIDIPIGADGGADRLLIAARDARPRCIVGTPNFLLYLASIAPSVIGVPATDLGVERLIVGGEPGGGNPAIRQAIEAAWGAKCCEFMGGTDLGCVYWAESDDQTGMYFVGPDYIVAELIDPVTEAPVAWNEGATGELVYTSLQRQASPVLRFRSGDHVQVTAMGGTGGRTTPAIRCFGRTDDMLIVRGVNIFPSAIQDVVSAMTPLIGGAVRVLADFEGHATQSNLKLLVERADDQNETQDEHVARQVETRVRNALAVKVEVRMVNHGFFAAPGAQKVTLTLRKMPDLETASATGDRS